eukprot:2307463-Pyramimonas_sp.AAC.1
MVDNKPTVPEIVHRLRALGALNGPRGGQKTTQDEKLVLGFTWVPQGRGPVPLRTRSHMPKLCAM